METTNKHATRLAQSPSLRQSLAYLIFASRALLAILRPMSQYIQSYDCFMLAVLAGATIYGFWRGMAWQIAALASVLVSAAVALHTSPLLAPVFGKQEPWNRFAAIAVLYIVTAMLIWLLFRLVRGVINRVQLKQFDRQLGTLFGLASGVLYCVVITFFAVTLSETARQSVLQSRSGYFIARGIREANPILPARRPQVVGQVHRRTGPEAAYPAKRGSAERIPCDATWRERGRGPCHRA